MTLKSYFIGLKPGFGQNFWDFFSIQVKKIISLKSDSTQHQKTWKTLKKLKFQIESRGPLLAIFNQLFCCQRFWMIAIKIITKIVTMVLLFKIDTCIINKIPLSLGQCPTWTFCQPSWMSAITKNHKNGYQLVNNMNADQRWWPKGPVYLN